jgi:hypothetical protein
MAVYFAFSDECGDYKHPRDKTFIASHPYYIRSTLIINGDSYLNEFNILKKEFNIDPNKEFKWNYLWSIYKGSSNTYKYFCINDKNNFSYSILLEFVDRSLKLLSQLDDCKILYTITDNKNKKIFCKYPKLLEMHLRSILQRIQMEMQSDNSNLCVLFSDSINKEKNKLLRQAYFDIFTQGDFIESYSNIKDSINIEDSKHSIGIQYADFIAGILMGLMKGYQDSKNLFLKYLLNKLRKGKGLYWGYGLCEILTDSIIRKELQEISGIS